jgi:hypothetical protein
MTPATHGTTLTMQVVNRISKRPSPLRDATVGEVDVTGNDIDTIRIEQDDVTGNVEVTTIVEGTEQPTIQFTTTDELYQGISTDTPRRKIDDTVQDALLELGFAVIDPQ